jgi:hypothetical protein
LFHVIQLPVVIDSLTSSDASSRVELLDDDEIPILDPCPLPHVQSAEIPANVINIADELTPCDVSSTTVIQNNSISSSSFTSSAPNSVQAVDCDELTDDEELALADKSAQIHEDATDGDENDDVDDDRNQTDDDHDDATEIEDDPEVKQNNVDDYDEDEEDSFVVSEEEAEESVSSSSKRRKFNPIWKTSSSPAEPSPSDLLQLASTNWSDLPAPTTEIDHLLQEMREPPRLKSKLLPYQRQV